jgi:hypothetical protein
MKLVYEHINETIKHLKPRSEKDIEKQYQKDINDLESKSNNQLIDEFVIAPDESIYEKAIINVLIKRNAKELWNISTTWTDKHKYLYPQLMQWYKLNSVNNPNKKITESIKYLKPKSDEEIQKFLKDLDPFEKFSLGCKESIIWLIDEGIKEGKIDFNKDRSYLFYVYNSFNKGDEEIAMYFINLGFDIHSDNEKALRWAIWNFENYENNIRSQKIKLAKYLIKIGASLYEAGTFAIQNAFTEQIKSIQKFRQMFKINN